MKSIFERVSIRQYTEQPVEQEKIIRILQAAMQAPSAGNQQPWEFYVVTNPSMIQELAESSPYAGCAANASVLIVPVYRTKNLVFPEYAQIDLSIAQEHMWLEANELGLGGVWLGIAPLQERMDAVKKIMNLPDDVEAFSIFALGYPAETRVQEKRFDETRIHYVK
ncbi:MAG: nitroreductase family protein [Clostridia bacterium]|nr:nitroreductase family protein [Lachnospiraceae bacterium]NCC00181.1 nitroreductase family protein [Clostridia bacterium]NCD03396.1 nitroreductase family protein [Clostridia bacterium]